MIAKTEQESQDLYAAYTARVQTEAQVSEIVQSMRDARFPGALLPTDERLDGLFAVAADHLSWHRLVPLLDARIAYELSDLPSFVRSGPAAEQLADLLGGYSPFLWCPIRLAPSPLRKAAVSACARLVKNVIEEAAFLEPPRVRHSIAELLDSFSAAIQREEVAVAEQILNELRDRDLLDGLNQRFLMARLFKAQGPASATRLAALVGDLKGLPVPEQLKKLFGPEFSE